MLFWCALKYYLKFKVEIKHHFLILFIVNKHLLILISNHLFKNCMEKMIKSMTILRQNMTKFFSKFTPYIFMVSMINSDRDSIMSYHLRLSIFSLKIFTIKFKNRLKFKLNPIIFSHAGWLSINITS